MKVATLVSAAARAVASLLVLGLGTALTGCGASARPGAPTATSDGGKSRAEAPAEPAAPPEPAAPSEPAPRNTGGVRAFSLCPETEASRCREPGSACVSVVGQLPECVSVVEARTLLRPAMWSQVVLVEKPVIGRRDLHLRCKAKHCTYPGASLEVSDGQALPLVTWRSESPWASTELICRRSDPQFWDPAQQDHWLCPARYSSRILGIVRPHFETDEGPPRLEFEVVAVDSGEKQ